MPFKNWVIFGLIFSGSGIGVLSTSYYSTKSSVLDEVKGNALRGEKGTDSEWNYLQNKLKSLDDTQLEKDGLKRMKENMEGNELKRKCEEKYKETYFTIFSTTNKEAKDFVEKYCIYKIKEKMGENNRVNKLQDAEAKMNKLKNHTDGKENGYLNYELKDIQRSLDKARFVKWCTDRYEEGYLGVNDNKWILVHNYCSK